MSLAAIADHMASKGRGPDSMLIHMSPREVQGLQALAMKNGGSLTINPDTGLPEAGFLDKLLPTIIGAGLTFFSGGAINPMMAASIVGGIQTVRTGDLGKGLAAGLGAYGGAGITQGLTTAGGNILSGEATSLAAQQAGNLAGEQATQMGLSDLAKQQMIDEAGSATARVATDASPFAKLSAGFDAAKANPMQFANKDNFKYLAAAAGPILADQAVKSNMPTTVTKPGMIRPYSFDPYGGTYTAGTPYETAPTKAAGGGLMGIADGRFNFAQSGGPVVGMADGGYTQFTNEEIGKYLTDNPNVDIAAATKQFNADPAAVNQYISGLTSGYTDPTATKGGSGTAGFYNQLTAQGIDPNEYYAAMTAVDPNYATQGFSKADIAEQYGIHKGAYALSDQLKGNVADKDWAKFMDANNYSVLDAARAFGLSTDEVQRRYDAARQPVSIADARDVPGGVGGVNAVVNYNDTITQRSAIPGATSIDPTTGAVVNNLATVKGLKDLYTTGGGSLGYTPTAPKTIDEFNASFNKLTGGSKAAYDYLMGKTPYSPTPYTPTGEIQKPYFESVGKAPVNLATKKYIFKDGKYELNPAYVKPSYVLAAEKAAAGKETTKADAAAGKSINVLDAQGNNEQAYLRDDGFYYSSGGTKFDEKGAQVVAGGGLMAMARGGMSQQFDLGGYSDGGRLLRGPGDGVSDSIPATIGNKRPARLADGEFVVPARIVSELGNGSTEAGARKLYAMMDRVQAARRGSIGKGKVAKNTRASKYLPA
jgi:hypothetical protein